VSGRTEAPAETPASPTLLTREAILGADDTRTGYVDVPEWGGRIKVRSLTGTERDALDGERGAALARGAIPPNWRTKRVAMAIIDEEGRSLFSEKDVAALGRKNGAVIDRIDDVVLDLSGMREATPERPSSLDEATAELGKGRSSGSGTG
jgi:hypothetical protein